MASVCVPGECTLHRYLEDITEVYEHVAGALGPAGDVDTGRDHVGALTAPGGGRQLSGEGEGPHT